MPELPRLTRAVERRSLARQPKPPAFPPLRVSGRRRAWTGAEVWVIVEAVAVRAVVLDDPHVLFHSISQVSGTATTHQSDNAIAFLTVVKRSPLQRWFQFRLAALVRTQMDPRSHDVQRGACASPINPRRREPGLAAHRTRAGRAVDDCPEAGFGARVRPVIQRKHAAQVGVRPARLCGPKQPLGS